MLKMSVEFLLKHNANAVDGDGRTALYHPVFNNNPEIIKALLTAGADVNVKDKKGNTPLMAAAHKGHVEIAELLLKKGANPNVVESNEFHNEYSALHFAVQEVHFPVVKLLIEHHADPNIGEGAGAELYYAKQKNPAIAKEMEDYLFSHGADKKAYLARYEEAKKVVEIGEKLKAEAKREYERGERAKAESARQIKAGKKYDEINRKLGNILNSIGDAAREKK